MDIQIDTREHDEAVKGIKQYFDNNGIRHFDSKMFVGDYMSLDNARFCIDRKQRSLCAGAGTGESVRNQAGFPH